MATWSQYLGPHVTSEEYKAQGGTEATLRRDLAELWGDPKQGDDYMSPAKIRDVAKALAQQYDL